jgi:hypothetical protein
MQIAAAEVSKLDGESKATLDLYGVNDANTNKAGFAKNCLLALAVALPAQAARIERAEIRHNHGRYEADATVVNADFARSMTRLVPDALRRRWSDRKIASRRFSRTKTRLPHRSMARRFTSWN